MLHNQSWDTLQSNGLLLASEGACLIHTLQPWMRNGGERNVHHSPMMLLGVVYCAGWCIADFTVRRIARCKADSADCRYLRRVIGPVPQGLPQDDNEQCGINALPTTTDTLDL